MTMTSEPTTYTVERQKLRLLMGWIETCPSELAVTSAHFAGLASKIFGREIAPQDLTDLHEALTCRDTFEAPGWNADQMLAAMRYQELQVERATDTLLDCRRCAGCQTVIPDDTTTSDCTDGSTYCSWQEHQDFDLSTVGYVCDNLR